MKLSARSRYAVMAMVDLASTDVDAPLSLATIANRQALPLTYLEQIFVKLRKAGLVLSSRGSSGGYHLAFPAKNIRIFDIIAAVDRLSRATRCDWQSPKGCQNDGGRCVAHDLWEELETVVQLFLKRITLADVCGKRVLGYSSHLTIEKSEEA